MGILAQRRAITMVEDPVCGMELMPEDAVAESEYDGQIYYFCSLECKTEFDSDPEGHIELVEDEVYSV
jgi:YHS domain-containing protein